MCPLMQKSQAKERTIRNKWWEKIKGQLIIDHQNCVVWTELERDKEGVRRVR